MTDDRADAAPQGPQGEPDALARLLTAAVAADGVPLAVQDAARGAFAWRTIDADLATLSYDSADELAGAGTRGPRERMLTFEFDNVVIDLEVSPRGPLHELTGQVVTASDVDIEVQQPSGPSQQAVVDRLGRFQVAGVPSGPLRLLCRFPGSAARAMVLTEWVVI